MIIYDDGIGMDNSRSLSLASKIWVLAIAALPIIISTKLTIAYIAKYIQPTPMVLNAVSAENIEPNIKPNTTSI